MGVFVVLRRLEFFLSRRFFRRQGFQLFADFTLHDAAIFDEVFVVGQHHQELLKQSLEQVVLYGSRAMGRHHSGSDVDLCLLAPSLDLEDLLLLGARLDDLLLPWRFDLQLKHRIDHPGLLEHIE